MDLRRGYKKTDGGIIPEDWEYRPIAEYARLESGHTPSKKFATYWNGSIPWVSLHDTDLLDRNFIDDTSLKITELGLANSSARLLPAGTVVFSRTATVGKASIITQPMATSQDFANYICGPRLFNQYLGYLFRAMQPVWKSLMAGSTHNTIYMPAFERLRIVVPPLGEQHAIVETLVDVDESIDAICRLIRKKRDLRAAVTEGLVTGASRLPGFETPWQERKLGEFGRTYGGLTGKRKSDFGNGIGRYVTFMGVVGSAFVASGSFEDVHIRPTEKQNRVLKGDVLFNGSSETPEEVALCTYVDGDHPDLYLNSFCFGFRPIDPSQQDGRFLVHYLRSEAGRRLVKELAQGSTRYNISKKSLMKVAIAMPEVTEQVAIVNAIADFDLEIANLEARLEKTRALKQGMMQALLTGRVRLPVQGEALDALEVVHA